MKTSREPTRYGVHCNGDVLDSPCNNGEIIFLTREEYSRQMNKPDSFWQCPICMGSAWWDDDNSERTDL